MKIEEIADFPAAQQLARSLWGHGKSRGAAVLVGAGFSLNSLRSGQDTPKPPLWPELVVEMAKRLYPNNSNGVRNDPLRLAEEFRVYFGQSALDELIRTRVCDAAWQPGLLHRSLLDLPWSDVLTTNWDTLLERAANGINDYQYHPVRSPDELAHATAPRIVKLHGSIGTSQHFIVAEEDYRTYPVKFAAFVNFAREVFIENELCLIGFSGDDPNFLQWSGWVRDNLASSSRRIFLVGSLKLDSAKRKYLEAKNISPVDLWPLVRDHDDSEKHSVAAEKFLSFLRESRPKSISDWKPLEFSAYDFAKQSPEDWQKQFTDDGHAASLLDRAGANWQSDRLSYPNWLVCPADRRRSLLLPSSIVAPRKSAFKYLSQSRAAELLYELTWRFTISNQELSEDLRQLLTEYADPSVACGLQKSQQLEMAVLLLKDARRNNDEPEFDRLSQLIEKNVERGTDLSAEVAYHRALRARDLLSYFELEQL
jgi:SIR2-like domain